MGGKRLALFRVVFLFLFVFVFPGQTKKIHSSKRCESFPEHYNVFHWNEIEATRWPVALLDTNGLNPFCPDLTVAKLSVRSNGGSETQNHQWSVEVTRGEEPTLSNRRSLQVHLVEKDNIKEDGNSVDLFTPPLFLEDQFHDRRGDAQNNQFTKDEEKREVAETTKEQGETRQPEEDIEKELLNVMGKGKTFHFQLMNNSNALRTPVALNLIRNALPSDSWVPPVSYISLYLKLDQEEDLYSSLGFYLVVESPSVTSLDLLASSVSATDPPLLLKKGSMDLAFSAPLAFLDLPSQCLIDTYESQTQMVYPFPDDLSRHDRDFLRTYFIELCTGLLESNFSKVSEMVNVKSFANEFLITNFLRNPKGYNTETFYARRSSEMFEPIVNWDYQNAMEEEMTYYFPTDTRSTFLFHHLAKMPEFRKLLSFQWYLLRHSAWEEDDVAKVLSHVRLSLSLLWEKGDLSKKDFFREEKRIKLFLYDVLKKIDDHIDEFEGTSDDSPVLIDTQERTLFVIFVEFMVDFHDNASKRFDSLFAMTGVALLIRFFSSVFVMVHNIPWIGKTPSPQRDGKLTAFTLPELCPDFLDNHLFFTSIVLLLEYLLVYYISIYTFPDEPVGIVIAIIFDFFLLVLGILSIRDFHFFARQYVTSNVPMFVFVFWMNYTYLVDLEIFWWLKAFFLMLLFGSAAFVPFEVIFSIIVDLVLFKHTSSLPSPKESGLFDAVDASSIQDFDIPDEPFIPTDEELERLYDEDASHFVSFHIPCYDEPPAMVIKTLNVLSYCTYPFEVIVIDNNTPDPKTYEPLEKQCNLLGSRFHFYHVSPLAGAKAGALNFALTKTSPKADLVCIVDADFLIHPDFCRAHAPFFDNDPKFAYVQVSQDYYDWRDNPFGRMCYYEYLAVYRVTLPSLNELGTAFTIGTMNLLLKSAMEEVGGWAEWSLAEDSELSGRMAAAGYHGLYFESTWGYGLIPETFRAYKKQRFRWAAGPVQQFKFHLEYYVPEWLWGTPNKMSWTFRAIEGFRTASINYIFLPFLFVSLFMFAGFAIYGGYLDRHFPVPFLLIFCLFLVTQLPLLLLRYFRGGVHSFFDIVGGQIAVYSLYLVKTYATWMAYMPGNVLKWQRTTKFRQGADWIRLVWCCKSELILGLVSFALFLYAGSHTIQHMVFDELPPTLALLISCVAFMLSVVLLCAPYTALVANLGLSGEDE